MYFKRDITLGGEKDMQYVSFIGLKENSAMVNKCASIVIEKLED